MRIAVFGLGYVGAVCSACLAHAGHEVIGIDIAAEKVASINAGRSPIVERGLAEMIADVVAAGSLRASTDGRAAVAESELSFICVGTPSGEDGAPNLAHVRSVCAEIGCGLAANAGYHVVVMRSTVLPGTARKLVVPLLEASSGKRAGRDFGVVSNPEFLRESSAIEDFRHPPKTVIGEFDARSADLLAELYAGLDAPLVRIPLEAAEMVKFTDNAWHAAKVAFANEIGNICKAFGIDGHTVMEAFCEDRTLNISPAYLRPGFAFGGSCLPKDVRALCHAASSLVLPTPLLGALLPSNEAQIAHAVDLVRARPGRRVSLLGLSFKAGTDDLRESPLVELARRLDEAGYDVRIFDSNVVIERLTGANREQVLGQLPRLPTMLLAKLDDALAHGDVLVVGNGAAEFGEVPARLRPGQSLIDLVRVSPATSAGAYEGICW
ncbi:MAG: UDP-glucose/GDP-mannose dehydrogenase family protein [Gammaproteobacteria bacterium]